jgi:hypothetical protein
VTSLSREARNLRRLHSLIDAGELLCLAYLWFCALTRRRDRWQQLSVAVLVGEGAALVIHGGCPMGGLPTAGTRRRADVRALVWFEARSVRNPDLHRNLPGWFSADDHPKTTPTLGITARGAGMERH